MAAKSSEGWVAALRQPFPASQVGLLPRTTKRPELEYVGHGAVTARLLDVDPEWTWEPLGYDSDGKPVLERNAEGNPVGLWIKLTVNGVTRVGYGDCESGQFSAVKVLIGDALRNAAMRFGVALDLWVRGHAEDDEKFRGDTQGGPSVVAPPPPSPEEQELLEYEEMIWQLCVDLKKLDEPDGPFITSLRDTVGGKTINQIKDWISRDPAIAEDVVSTLINAVKQRQEAPAVEKPKRTRAKPGSAVEDAAAAVKKAFPGATEE